MSEIPTIGNVIRQWREQHFKLNVTAFAKRAGMSKGYISAVENNVIKNPTDENLEKLAAAIGISVRELLARKLPSDPENQERPQPTGSVASHTKESGSPQWQGADFSFASPLSSSRQLSEEEQLRRILAHVDELRGMIERLIKEKGHDHA
jgi:transcriptional regulator with XRE-family HTH domain